MYQKKGVKVLWIVLILSFGLICSLSAQEKTNMSKTVQGDKFILREGQSRIIHNVKSYDIGNPDVVSGKSGESNELILHAENQGITTVLVKKTNELGVVRYEVEVIGVSVEAIYSRVQSALSSVIGLHINKEGNVVVLEGDIISRNDGRKIDRQKKLYGDTILDLTNRTYMRKNLERLQEELNQSHHTNIKTTTQIGEDGEEVLVLRGKVFSEKQKKQVLNLARNFFDPERIVESLQVDRPQIEVDMEIYTLDKSKLSELGSNDLFHQLATMSSTPWKFLTGPTDGSSVQQYPEITVGEVESATLKALNESGAVINQSTQHVSVRSGETANINNVTEQIFKVEGAYDAKLEEITVGQILEISPVVLDTGRFETNINGELSELVEKEESNEDIALAVARRNIQTNFISGLDETVILGGGKILTTVENEERTPLLGHIPVINLLFKHNKKDTKEAINVFFMTLRSPTIREAVGEAQSRKAVEQKNMIEEKAKTYNENHEKFNKL